MNIHISTLKKHSFFSFINGNKIYKVVRFSSNRKYLYYVDKHNNEYSLDLSSSFYVVKHYNF